MTVLINDLTMTGVQKKAWKRIGAVYNHFKIREASKTWIEIKYLIKLNLGFRGRLCALP